ncbi:MAG: spore coat protein [Peptococcaceae bacterium]|jgi:spore coat protein CotF|nr:spore coat protein [Peptococcaceae bacterium]
MNGLSEKDIMVDLLNDTKLASDCYHAAILEAANDNVWNTFVRLHNDELTGARVIFNLMHQRGWYQLQPATGYQQQGMHANPAYQQAMQSTYQTGGGHTGPY